MTKLFFVSVLLLAASVPLSSGEPPEFQVRETKAHNGLSGRPNVVFEIKGHGKTCYVFATPTFGTAPLWCEPTP